MTEEEVQNTQEKENTAPASLPEGDDYTGRIIRTIVAVIAGFGAGVICFVTDGMATRQGAEGSVFFSLLILIAAIIVQKHIFMLLRQNPSRLEKKDWFYQGFMTFSFWFVTWTVLLSGTAPLAA